MYIYNGNELNLFNHAISPTNIIVVDINRKKPIRFYGRIGFYQNIRV